MIAAYAPNFPRYPVNMIQTRIVFTGFGFKVQYRHFFSFVPYWRSVADTHPGHGGSIEQFDTREDDVATGSLGSAGHMALSGLLLLVRCFATEVRHVMPQLFEQEVRERLGR